MAPKRKKDDSSTHKDILSAALDEFAENGFHGARIDEIANVSGANKAMIYYHFKSKQGLYEALAESLFSQVFSLVKTERESDLPANERIFEMSRLFSSLVYSMDDKVRKVILWELASGGKTIGTIGVAKLIKPLLITVRNTYKEGMKHGVIRKDIDPVYTHITIIGSIVFSNIVRMIMKDTIVSKIVFSKDFDTRFAENLVSVLQSGIELPSANRKKS